MKRRITLASLILTAFVTAACQTRPVGGLEGRTLDTPEQAFTYFRDAVKLERYDLEYAVFSKEFIANHGNFTLQDYVRGRPWATGELADLLEALMKAEIDETAYDDAGREARLVLTSSDFRGEVFLVRKTFWRIGVTGLPVPLEGTREELASLIEIDKDSIALRLPRTPDMQAKLGDQPLQPAEITRVEAYHRWYLLDLGRVEKRP